MMDLAGERKQEKSLDGSKERPLNSTVESDDFFLLIFFFERERESRCGFQILGFLPQMHLFDIFVFVQTEASLWTHVRSSSVEWSELEAEKDR
jgi:hypothetical protein